MNLFRKLSCSVAVAMIFAAPVHAWDAERGESISTACAACHGQDGNSPVPDFPSIAGQYQEYLFQALRDYQNGVRQDPIMAGQVAEMSLQDMRDLAAFYASQDGLKLKR